MIAVAQERPRLPLALPDALSCLIDPPLGSVRYRVVYGGRVSCKSWSAARALLAHGAHRQLRILCAREYQSSIRESVHELLAAQVEALGLDGFYAVDEQRIRGINGTEFIFTGIKRDPHKIKSLEGIDLCWVEEAEAVSRESWSVLRPTIRAPGSEIWVTFNPQLPTDPTWQLFVEDPPADALVVRVSWRDNPWLSDEMRAEREDMLRRDPEAEANVWGGDPWERTDAQILAGRWSVEEFEPKEGWDGPYYGADWGFARDPTVLVRAWLADSRLWIEYDERGIGWNLEEIVARFNRVPGAGDHAIRGDSARPETIHELCRRGLKVMAADKWPGSVKDGIEHLRTYERIVIHPRCAELVQEARLWRYKRDARTADVLPDVAPGNDHGWDAVRYALQPMIRRRPTWGLANA